VTTEEEFERQECPEAMAVRAPAILMFSEKPVERFAVEVAAHSGAGTKH
jgi:hypothetical protein